MTTETSNPTSTDFAPDVAIGMDGEEDLVESNPGPISKLAAAARVRQATGRFAGKLAHKTLVSARCMIRLRSAPRYKHARAKRDVLSTSFNAECPGSEPDLPQNNRGNIFLDLIRRGTPSANWFWQPRAALWAYGVIPQPTY